MADANYYISPTSGSATSSSFNSGLHIGDFIIEQNFCNRSYNCRCKKCGAFIEIDDYHIRNIMYHDKQHYDKMYYLMEILYSYHKCVPRTATATAAATATAYEFVRKQAPYYTHKEMLEPIPPYYTYDELKAEPQSKFIKEIEQILDIDN